MDKNSVGVIQLFNQTWLSLYPHPCEFLFVNGSEFKGCAFPFLKELLINHVYVIIKTLIECPIREGSQSNT